MEPVSLYRRPTKGFLRRCVDLFRFREPSRRSAVTDDQLALPCGIRLRLLRIDGSILHVQRRNSFRESYLVRFQTKRDRSGWDRAIRPGNKMSYFPLAGFRKFCAIEL